ncbi:MAG: plastocyanin [Anaerolineae bacterium]|nr:plastocyanin [Gloeobacterales cyanobacterium ES-bin-313]
MKIAPFVLAGSVLLLVACSGGDSSKSTDKSETETESSETTPEQGETKTIIGTAIKMGSDTGTLVFVPAKLTVKPGDKITWVMNKAGPHNAIFDTKGSPDSNTAKALSENKLLVKSGDTVVVEVPGNAKPGDYKFNCVPHKSAGMVGVLTIAK